MLLGNVEAYLEYQHLLVSSSFMESVFHGSIVEPDGTAIYP